MSNLKRGQESLGARGRGKKHVWARQRGAKGVRFKKKVARVAGTCRGFQQSGSRAWRVSEFQASLHKEHHASRDYTVRPCLKEEKEGRKRSRETGGETCLALASDHLAPISQWEAAFSFPRAFAASQLKMSDSFFTQPHNPLYLPTLVPYCRQQVIN